MLRWRIILGVLFIGLLALLSKADMQSQRPGLCLLPLAILLAVLASQEMLRLLRAANFKPVSWIVYFGTTLTVLFACAPIAWQEYPVDCPVGRLGWLACGLSGAIVIALVSEVGRYQQSSPSIANLCATSLSLLYVGGLLGFILQLRLLPVGGNTSAGGMLALLSMIIVVKATDIGAYTTGRLFGRRKLAPTLSPGKTWEGAIGGLIFAVIGSMLALGPLAESLDVEITRSGITWLTIAVIYGLVVGAAGVFGDLAESMLKRDAGVKDSSEWLLGFGGVLDLLDSLLLAAPVAYVFWVSGLIV